MRSLLLLLVLALSGEPYRLVLKDGTVLSLSAAPEERKGRLVGTLAGPGTLVSVLPGQVDRELTDAANRKGPAGPPPDVVVPLRPAGGPPLGDRVKLQVSAEEARKRIEVLSGTAKPEPTPAPDDVPERAEPGSKRPPKEGGEHLDNQGRGEAFWRARAEKARRAASDAATAREAAESNVASWEHAMPSGDAAIQTWARELARLRHEAERARRDEKVVQKRLEDLREEARKADAYPGWLR